MYGEFELKMPEALNEALELARTGGELLAGGTNLLVDLRARRLRPSTVISLDRVAALRGITATQDRITLGARTTVSDLLHSEQVARFGPALVQAAQVFAGQMVRNAATVGGNIACGSPAADLVPPLMALGADLTLAGPDGTRTVPLHGFFTGYKEDCRKPGEIITAVSWPLPPAHSRQSFYKLARRHGDAITVTGVAVLLATENGTCTQVRIALGAVAPYVIRARRAEKTLKGTTLATDRIERAAALAAEECSPIDDVRASADYRRHTVEVLTRRLLLQAWDSLNKGSN